MRLLDPALARTYRSGERSTDVTEQLGFEQGFWNGPTVERHERVRASRAVMVDRSGDELLARARFAGDEDCAGGRGHHLEQPKQITHRLAAADNPFESITFVKLRSQVGIFGSQPALLERRRQDVQQLIELERLGDEVRRTTLDSLDGTSHGAVAGHDDADDFGVALEGCCDDVGTVHARQAQVGHHDVIREVSELLQGFLSAPGLVDPEPLFCQPLGGRLAKRPFVLDDQQMFLAFNHLVG